MRDMLSSSEARDQIAGLKVRYGVYAIALDLNKHLWLLLRLYLTVYPTQGLTAELKAHRRSAGTWLPETVGVAEISCAVTVSVTLIWVREQWAVVEVIGGPIAVLIYSLYRYALIMLWHPLICCAPIHPLIKGG